MGLLKEAMQIAVIPAFMAANANADTINQSNPFQITPDTQTTEHEIRYVDRHLVFVIDVSGSVEPAERVAMQRGIAEALASEENSGHFTGFSDYAMTVVFFADSARSLQTVFVSSQEEAIDSLSASLWDFESSLPASNLTGVGSGTDMYDALLLVDEIYDTEQSEGFSSISKSVVVLGDAAPSPSDMIAVQIGHLAQTHGATVHALPVVLGQTDDSAPGHSTVQFFREAVATPEGLLHVTEEGGIYRVQQGVTMPVLDATNVSFVVGQALDLNRF